LILAFDNPSYIFMFILPYRPEQRFEEHIPAEDNDTLEPKKMILKRSKELVAAAAAASQKVCD